MCPHELGWTYYNKDGLAIRGEQDQDFDGAVDRVLRFDKQEELLPFN